MPAWLVPAAISGISALAGLLGNKSKTNTQTSNTTSNNVLDTWLQQFMDQYTDTQRSAQTQETPTMDPLQAAMRDKILNAYSNRMMEDPDMRGYAGQGLRDINAGENIASQALRAKMGQAGLSFSPAGMNAQANLTNQAMSDKTSFLSKIPLLAREMQLKDLGAFGQFFSSLPTGRSTNMTGYDSSRTTGINTSIGQNRQQGTSSSQGTMTDPGNPWAGLFSGLGSGLASTYGYQWANNLNKPKRGSGAMAPMPWEG